LSVQFHAVFRVDQDEPLALESHLSALFRLREHLRTRSSKMSRWYMCGNTKEEAFLYEAFDEVGFTAAALAVLKEEDRRNGQPAVFHGAGLWNGEDPPDAASMVLFASLVDVPSTLLFSTRSPDLLTHDNVLATTLKIVELWRPRFVSVKPNFYDPVFKNRPGAGWMLYLPTKLSAQQVPEARGLAPAMENDSSGTARQIGTVIVSIDDGPFSAENPEHVKRANDIEIGLAGQDLLPSFGHSDPQR
jgi:hypothetical protein